MLKSSNTDGFQLASQSIALLESVAETPMSLSRCWGFFCAPMLKPDILNGAGDYDGNGVHEDFDMFVWRFIAAFENGFNGPYLRADANLDGVVDVSDLNVLRRNMFSKTCLVSNGDFNCDGVVDVSDRNILFEELFMSTP